METLTQSLIVPYSAAQMYHLVNDVARYPDFVPYCCAAEIHAKSAQHMQATLRFAGKGLKTAVTTHNKLTPDRAIQMQLIKGPLPHLTGDWAFEPVDAERCRVQLSLCFLPPKGLFGRMLGKPSASLIERVLDAYCQEAAKRLLQDT